jgi:hypothetical protein
MAQVTIYMDNELESKVKKDWDSSVVALNGCWDDDISLDYIRDTKANDFDRIEF